MNLFSTDQDRLLKHIHPFVLQSMVGQRCLIKGTVISRRKNNPFIRGTSPNRQFMLLLQPCTIGSWCFNHLWVPGYTRLKQVEVGNGIVFTAVVKTYVDKEEVKIGLTTSAAVRDVVIIK